MRLTLALASVLAVGCGESRSSYVPTAEGMVGEYTASVGRESSIGLDMRSDGTYTYAFFSLPDADHVAKHDGTWSLSDSTIRFEPDPKLDRRTYRTFTATGVADGRIRLWTGVEMVRMDLRDRFLPERRSK